jgi:hypothetical protein
MINPNPNTIQLEGLSRSDLTLLQAVSQTTIASTEAQIAALPVTASKMQMRQLAQNLAQRHSTEAKNLVAINAQIDALNNPVPVDITVTP